MGFVAFVGRVLFASIFLLSAVQEFREFGVDGGPAAKAFQPKFDQLSKHLHPFSFPLLSYQMKHIIAGTVALKGLGGLLFIFGSTLGASLLAIYLALVTPILNDFYNHLDKPEFSQLFLKFTQDFRMKSSDSLSLAEHGSVRALLFFLGMKDSSVKRASKKKPTKVKTV
ncbi:unnamed protein product [Spirodela intermedia]|uniref:Uncharacterized protein n=1 Tax=Spirodela intermedia TaxID=51605 RepID=A0A7I8IX94_SPIIN|nr:unnamed protein product [Spirodela intermedia]CAA6662614.1 unnamed protein product [Spirodela intermedia]